MRLLSIYLLLFLSTSYYMKGQVNLVPNPSFEDTIGACQIQMGVSSLGAKIKNWYTCYVGSTPDCYNMCVNSLAYPTICSVPYNCRTYQMPRTGEAFLGLWTYSVMDALDSSKIESENIAVKLATPLKPNVCYYGEFYANLGNISNVAINQLGMLLTSNIYTTTVGSFTNTINPQIQWDTTYWFTDTLNWVKISGTFIAQGGEEYLTIGNFRDGLHLNKKSILSNFVTGGCSIINTFKNYFLIDDVALYEIPPPQLQENEVTICPDSDSLLLGDTARIQTSYQWYENGIAIDTTSYIKVKPGQTTTYVLQSTSCATTSQTIVVTYSANCTPPEPIEVVEPIIPNVFSPNNDNINDVWRFHLGKGNSLKSLSIFNRWGNDVTPSFYEQEKQNVSTVLWDGRTTSGEPVSSGVYFYVLQYTDAMGEQHKKNGYITLIR